MGLQNANIQLFKFLKSLVSTKKLDGYIKFNIYLKNQFPIVINP